MAQSTPASVYIGSNVQTPRGSLYLPSESSVDVTPDFRSTTRDDSTPLTKLNEFLNSRDVSPVRHTVTVPWDEASERTRRRHLRKTQQAASAVLEEVAPKQSEKLWYSLVPSVTQKFSTDSESEDKDVDNVLMNALTECYSNARAWDTRRQILSIMADKVTFQTLKKWIPDLTGTDSILQESIQCFTGEVFHHHKHPTQNCSCHPHRSTTSWISLPVLTLSRICHSARRRSHCQQMRL